MNWLARLKSGKTLELDATKTTETIFVVSVAPTLASLQKSEGVTSAANDPAVAPTPMATDVIGTVHPSGQLPQFLAASMALDASIVTARTPPGLNPDAFCWPHSTAMNGTEIELFTERINRFTDKGLTESESKALTDKLLSRDRDDDDRRFCLECKHLSGHDQKSWRCGKWQAAGIAINSRDAQLPADLVVQLQRCEGFTA